MHSAILPAILIGRLAGVLGVALMLALPAPASAAMMPGAEPAASETPTVFSLIHVASGPIQARQRPQQAKPPRQLRLFGYPSANADELPPPISGPAAPALLFSHAALGVAILDTPASTANDTLVTADSGHLSARQLSLTMPVAPKPLLPSPLPIALIVALVLLPAALVLGQALRGPSRRPQPAMRRHNAPRRRTGE